MNSTEEKEILSLSSTKEDYIKLEIALRKNFENSTIKRLSYIAGVHSILNHSSRSGNHEPLSTSELQEVYSKRYDVPRLSRIHIQL